MPVGKYAPATPDFPNDRKETAMNAKPTLARPRVVTTVAAAALSTVIALGLLTAVTGLFQHEGAATACSARGPRPDASQQMPTTGRAHNECLLPVDSAIERPLSAT